MFAVSPIKREWTEHQRRTLLALAMALGLFALFFMRAQTAHAAACSFTGAVSTSYNVNGNWSCGGVPGNGDTVTIPAGTSTTLGAALGASSTVSTITVAAGSTLTITSGSVILAASSTVTIAGSGQFFADVGTVSTTALTISAATGEFRLTTGSASTTSINNSGTVRIGAGFVTSTDDITNTGTSTFSGAGMWDVLANFTNSGTFNAAALGTIRLGRGGNQSIPGVTYFNLLSLKTGGTATFAASSTVVNAVSMSGLDTWSVDGAGVGLTLVPAFTIPAASTFTIGAGSATSTGTLTNSGTLTMGTGTLYLNSDFTSADPTKFTHGTGTVILYGTGSPALAGVDYNNLENDKTASGIITLSASSTVLGTLTTSGANTFTTVGLDFTVLGATTIGSGTTVTSTSLGTMTFASVSSSGALGTIAGNILMSSLNENHGIIDVGAGVVTSTGAFVNRTGGVINNGTGLLSIGSIYINDNTYNKMSGTFRLAGSGNRNVDGESFYALQSIMTGNIASIVNRPVTVDTTLTMSGGGTLLLNDRALSVTGIATIGSGTTVTSTSGVLTFSSNVTSTGSIGTQSGGIVLSSTITNNGMFDIGSSSSTAVGIFTNNASGIVNGTGGTLHLYADWANTGTGTGNGTTDFAGSGAQSSTASTFFNLTKSAAGTLTFTGAVTALGSATSSAGTITTGGNALSISGTTNILVGAVVTSTSGAFTFGGTVSSTGSIGSVSGDKSFAAFTNNGTLDVGSGTATTTGTLTDNASGIINNDAGVLSVSGDFTRTGTYNAMAGTFRVAGGSAQNITGSTFNNVVSIKSGNTATIVTNPAIIGSTLVTSGAGTVSAANQNMSVAGTTTIGTGSTVTSTSGVLTLSGAVTNNGFLGTQSGGVVMSSTLANTAGTFNIGSSSSTALGTVTNGASGTIRLETGTLHVYADWAESGTLVGGSGTVDFAGGTQSSNTETSFFNLTKSAAGTLTFTGAVTALGSATSSAGTITTGGNALSISGTTNILVGAVVTSTSGAFTFGGTVSSTGSIGSVSGDKSFAAFTNNGTLDVGSGTATTTGTLTDNASGIINNDAGVLSVSGDFTRTGTYNAMAGTFRLAGTSAQNITGSTFNKLLSIKGSNTATFITNAPTIGSTLITSGGGTLTTAGLALSVTGAATIGSGTVVTSTTGVITFSNTITNNGSLGSLSGGFNLNGALTNNGTVDLGNGSSTANISITNAAAGTINGGSATLWLYGDLGNSGTIAGQKGTFTFTGTGAQSFGGSSNATNPYNLTINKASGTASLGGNVTSTGAFTLTSGTLAVGNNRFGATGTYTNTGLVTVGASGHIVHAADSVKFTDETYTLVSGYKTPNSIYFEVNDPDRNLNGSSIETFTITMKGDSAAGLDSELQTLTETTASSGVFRSPALSVLTSSVTSTNDSIFEVLAAGNASTTYTDVYDPTGDSTAVSAALTLGTGGGSGGGSGSGGGGGGGGMAPITTTQQSITYGSSTTPITSSTPATVTILGTGPTAPAATPPGTFVDPSDLTTLLSTSGLAKNTTLESTVTAQVKADAKEFGLTLTNDQLLAIRNYIAYGNSGASRAFGQGERRAIMRDYMETVHRSAVVWSDMERLATGNIPLTRNLTLERKQVVTTLPVFRKIFGHAPNFKDATENLAWNELMYRIRFTRDLVKETKGLKAFRKLYGHAPTSPFGWAIVRVLGYVK